MASIDPIGNALTKIRNASRAKHPTVDVRPSRVVAKILDVLRNEGFIQTYKPVGQQPADRALRVYLKYVRGRAAITHLVRISRPGVRLYRKAPELPRVLGGLGVAIITTSHGVMSERDAYRQRIGGEVVCYVW